MAKEEWPQRTENELLDQSPQDLQVPLWAGQSTGAIDFLSVLCLPLGAPCLPRQRNLTHLIDFLPQQMLLSCSCQWGTIVPLPRKLIFPCLLKDHGDWGRWVGLTAALERTPPPRTFFRGPSLLLVCFCCPSSPYVQSESPQAPAQNIKGVTAQPQCLSLMQAGATPLRLSFAILQRDRPHQIQQARISLQEPTEGFLMLWKTVGKLWNLMLRDASLSHSRCPKAWSPSPETLSLHLMGLSDTKALWFY